MEQWKEIPNLNGLYEASTLGRIKSRARTVKKRTRSGRFCEQKYQEKILTGSPLEFGHLTVHLSINGKKQTYSVHRLILETFVGPCPQGMEGCHNNGIAGDNRLSNLRWDTHLENNRDRMIHGKYAVGANHAMAKITDEQAIEIYHSKEPSSKLAARHGISQSHVWEIRSGRSSSKITGAERKFRKPKKM